MAAENADVRRSGWGDLVALRRTGVAADACRFVSEVRGARFIARRTRRATTRAANFRGVADDFFARNCWLRRNRARPAAGRPEFGAASVVENGPGFTSDCHRGRNAS